jgi:Tol biopolymer transport system component
MGSNLSRTTRRPPAIALATALVCACAPSADASFPGREGEIVFTRSAAKGDRVTLWSVNPATRRTRRLTSVPGRCRGSQHFWADYSPSFSASGGVLAYIHEDNCNPGTPTGIYTAHPDGTGREFLLGIRDPRYYLDWPAFTPDGQTVTFVRRNEKTSASSLWGFDRSTRDDPAPWLGGQHLFDRYQDDPDFAANGNLALSIIGISAITEPGKTIRASVLGNDYSPSWAPAGDRLIFTRFTDRSGGRPSIGTLYLGRAQPGSKPRRLLPGRTSMFPAWSPAGGRVAYVRAPGGVVTTGSLYLLRMSDRHTRPLIANVSADRIAWQPLPRAGG